jgi:hypothetical protein
MDPRDRHLGLRWQPAGEVENRAAGEDPTCPPEKPQGSLILGGPSVWLQNRDCA